MSHTRWKTTRSADDDVSPEYEAAYEEARDADELAQMVYDRRTELGLSQSELAKRAGMTQPQVSRLEGGDTVPTVPLLRRLAAALDCDLEVRFAEKRPASCLRGDEEGAAAADDIGVVLARVLESLSESLPGGPRDGVLIWHSPEGDRDVAGAGCRKTALVRALLTGLSHGDLHPDNILVQKAGAPQVLLIDFCHRHDSAGTGRTANALVAALRMELGLTETEDWKEQLQQRIEELPDECSV